jgi:hypothetical protein
MLQTATLLLYLIRAIFLQTGMSDLLGLSNVFSCSPISRANGMIVAPVTKAGHVTGLREYSECTRGTLDGYMSASGRRRHC